MRKISVISLLALSLLLQACLFHSKLTISGKGNIKLKQVEFQSFRNWENDDHKKSLQAFLHSCRKFAKLPQTRSLGGQIGEITAGDFRDVCDIAEVVKTMSNKQARNFFENWFKPFLVETRFGSSKGVFTGYYEASIRASKTKNDEFKYPIYARPDDLKSDPYLTRKEISEGALNDKGLEILYTDDKVELFFMHIQGSGRAKLPDGSEIKVLYAGRNNLPFTPIASYMVDRGLISPDNVNAASIKEWLKNNLEKADEIMNLNAAYTFFKTSDDEFVVGGQGVPLTPERSLAVDSEIIPYGFPLFVETSLKKKNGSKEDYQGLFIAQDTGSAIKGAVRGDIFFGYGERAVESASYMASQGQYYMLLPINLVDKMVGR